MSSSVLRSLTDLRRIAVWFECECQLTRHGLNDRRNSLRVVLDQAGFRGTKAAIDSDSAQARTFLRRSWSCRPAILCQTYQQSAKTIALRETDPFREQPTSSNWHCNASPAIRSTSPVHPLPSPTAHPTASACSPSRTSRKHDHDSKSIYPTDTSSTYLTGGSSSSPSGRRSLLFRCRSCRREVR